MTKIILAVFDTNENNRSKYTQQTLDSLCGTVDLRKHQIIVSDNGSCQKTQDIYKRFTHKIRILRSDSNNGTANAINKGILLRKDGEHVIKMDNDVIVHSWGWVDEMEHVINTDPSIGILGLKRKDLIQHPDSKDWPSTLKMVPHNKGEKWVVIEETKDIMGTCTMYNSKLLDRVGFLYQPSLYGFDDVLMSARSIKSGFRNAFLPHIEIDHIDVGGDSFCDWKQRHAGKFMGQISELINQYNSGVKDVYFDGKIYNRYSDTEAILTLTNEKVKFNTKEEMDEFLFYKEIINEA